MFIDYYQVLEVSHDASPDALKKAYRVQLHKWHPDKNQSAAAADRTRLIIESFLILSDPEARQLYDVTYREYYSIKPEERTTEEEYSTTTDNSSNKASFKFDGELLKKWINNARNQASDLANHTLEELSGSIKTGFYTFSQTLALRLVGGVILMLIIGLAVAGYQAAESTVVSTVYYSDYPTDSASNMTPVKSTPLSKADSLISDTTNPNRYSDAYPYLLESAKNNEVGAFATLGNMFHEGNGVKKNLQKSLEWYENGAALGDANCADWTGFLYEKKGKVHSAIKFYRQGAALNLTRSHSNLGALYLFNDKVRNYDSAAVYINKAIEGGDNYSYYLLGVMYEDGLLYNKDTKKALQLYKKSLDPEVGWRYSNVGRCFRDGIGCKPNKDSAKVYLQKGADLGDTDARSALKQL